MPLKFSKQTKDFLLVFSYGISVDDSPQFVDMSRTLTISVASLR